MLARLLLAALAVPRPAAAQEACADCHAAR
jgi:hypothetical protein